MEGPTVPTLRPAATEIGRPSVVEGKPTLEAPQKASVTQSDILVNGEVVDLTFTLDSLKTWRKIIGNQATRSKQAGAGAAQSLVYASRTYNKLGEVLEYQQASASARGKKAEGEALGKAPVLTKEEFGVGYLAVLSELRADMAYLLVEMNRDPYFSEKFSEALGALTRDKRFAPLTNFVQERLGAYQQFSERYGSRFVDESMLGGFKGLTEAQQIERVKELSSLLVQLTDAVGADSSDPLLAAKGYTREFLGEYEGQNALNQCVVEELRGNEQKGRTGILSDKEKYGAYYPEGRDSWEEMTVEEREDTWERIGRDALWLQDEALSMAIERSVGDWADGWAAQFQKEMREGYIGGGDIDIARSQLNTMQEVDKEEIGFQQKEVQVEFDLLDNSVKSVEADIRNLDDPAKGIKEVESKVDQAKQAKKRAVDSGDYEAARLEYEQAKSDYGLDRSIKEEAERTQPDKRKEIETAREDAIKAIPKDDPKYSEREKSAKDAAQRMLDELEKAVQKKKDIFSQTDARFKEKKKQFHWDDDIRGAEEALEDTRARKVRLEKELNGDSTVEGLRNRRRKKEKELKRLSDSLKDGGRGVLSFMAEAQVRAINLAEEWNFNAVMENVDRSARVADLADTTILPGGDGEKGYRHEGLCQGTVNARALYFEVLRDKAGDGGTLLGRNLAREEAQISEYEMMQNYIRAFGMDIRFTPEQDKSIVAETLKLNSELQKAMEGAVEEDRTSAWKNVIAARKRLNELLGPTREKVYAEIRRRNKFEIENAFRYTIKDQLNKAKRGEPISTLNYHPEPSPRYFEDKEMEREDVRRAREKIGRDLDNIETPLGRHAMMYERPIVLADKSIAFLVTRKTDPYPDSGEIVQELRKADGTIVPIEEGEAKDGLLLQLAIDRVEDIYRKKGKKALNLRGEGLGSVDRTIDRIRGRFVLTSGPEVDAAAGKVVYLDDALRIAENATLLEAFRAYSSAYLKIQRTNLETYELAQAEMGKFNPYIKGPQGFLTEWVGGHKYTRMPENFVFNFPRGLRKHLGGVVMVTARESGLDMMGRTKNFANFDEYDKWAKDRSINPDVVKVGSLNVNQGDLIYAAAADAAMDLGRRQSKSFLGLFEPGILEIPPPGAGGIKVLDRTEYWIGVSPDGKLRRRKIRDRGKLIADNQQVEEDMVDALNADLQRSGNINEEIFLQKKFIGERYMESLFIENTANPLTSFMRRVDAAARWQDRQLRRMEGIGV